MKTIFNLKSKFDLTTFEVMVEKDKEQGAVVRYERKAASRNLSQNALFHLWLSVFAEHIGEPSVEQCKADVKRVLLGTIPHESRITGEIYQVEKSTSKLDKAQFAAFMDKFKAWAMSDFGCYLPYFKDAGYEEMIKQY
jgi:hypothetical protein